MIPPETIMKTDFSADDINWKDSGCELFPACLTCPLPYCIEDKPRGKQKLLMLTRAGQMAELKRGGKSTREIARRFKVSQRTVQRTLAARGTRHD
jgi:transposase-like protein